MSTDQERFKDAAADAALELLSYGLSKGFDIFVIGAAGKMLFESAGIVAVSELARRLAQLKEEEDVDDVIREAEGVLRNGD